MAEHSADFYRALMLPDHRITSSSVWAAHSDYTQAGPKAGTPEPQQDTDLVLTATGDQTAGATLNVRAVRGGFAGAQSAQFVWKQTADTLWRGWDQPDIPHGWEAVSYTTTTNSFLNPHAVTLADGSILVSYGAIVGSVVTFYTRKRNASTGVWAAAVTVASFTVAATTIANAHCLLVLPSGRLLCFHAWAPPTSVGSLYDFQVQMRYSDDDGATWALGASDCLDTQLDGASGDSLKRLRAAYHPGLGQVVLLIHWIDVSTTYDDRVLQYGSSDMGMTFQLVVAQSGDTANTNSGGYVEAAYAQGGLVMFYIAKSDDILYAIPLSSAYEDFSTAESYAVTSVAASTQSGGIFTAGNAAICVDDRGWLWSHHIYHDANIAMPRAAVSYDGGQSWKRLSTEADTRSWGDQKDASGLTYPNNFSSTWQRGRAIVLHNFAANPGTADPSLCAAYLGGFTTSPMPLATLSGTGFWRQQRFGLSWWPMDLPGNTIWTAAGTAGTETLTSGYLDLHTTAGNSKTYTNTNGTYADGWVVRASFSRQAGSTAGVRLRLDNGGTDSYSIQLTISNTTATLTDNVAASTIATAGISDSTRYDFLIAMLGNRCVAYFRAFSTGEDVEWTKIGASTSLGDGGGGTANDVQFGHLTAGAAESQWYEVHATAYTDYNVSDHLADEPTNPDDLFGLPVAADQYTYIDDGVSVAAQSGPAIAGDDWNITPRYEHGVANLLLTEAPPRRRWRTTTNLSASHTVAWQLDTLADADFNSDLLGIYVESNATRLAVSYRVGAAWTSLMALTERETTGISFTRAGSSIELTACSGGGFYLEEDELAGMDFVSSSTIGRKILRNTSGWVPTSAGSTNKRPRLYLESAAGGDPASGSSGSIMWHRSLTVISLAGKVADGLQVSFDATSAGHPDPTDGYIWAKALIGPVYPIGRQYQSNRVVTHSPNVRVYESADRVIHGRRQGPAARTWALNWEQVDEKPLLAGTSNHLLASDVASAEPVGHYHDAGRLVAGAIEYLDESKTRLVYMPKLPHVTAAATMIVGPRADMAACVHMIGDLQVSTAMGDEGVDEVVGFGLTLREAV